VESVKLAKIVFALWILRWAAQELAAYSGRHWQAPGPPPRDSARAPGRLPGPSPESLAKFSKP
jgi:hypothetical protein